jgi:integrase
MFAWGDGSVAMFIDGLMAAFRWAVKKKLITANPIEGIDRPARRSRSRRCLVSDEQHERILASIRTAGFRAVVVCLHATGARPGELLAAEAKDWNQELQAVLYYGDDRRREDEFRHKTAGKSKDRAIYFTGEALALIRNLMGRHRTGPLFRTFKNGPWTIQTLGDAFRVLRKRVGMPDLIPYSYRHTFATNWLKAGRSVDVLAEILGNTPETIRRHYSHLCGDRAAIRRQLEDFFAAAGSERP